MRCLPFILLSLLVLAPMALAQAPDTPCPVGQAEALLEVGYVRARLFNTGGLFWRSSDAPGTPADPPVYEVPAGAYAVPFEASALPPGVYYARLQMGRLEATQPMLRVR